MILRFAPTYWLVSPLTERRVVGDRLADRILDAASKPTQAPGMRWVETPPVFRRGVAVRADNPAFPSSAIGVGTGAAICKEVERPGELAQVIQGITGQKFHGPVHALCLQAVRQLFAGRRESDVGLVWVTAGLEAATGPAAGKALSVRTVSGQARAVTKAAIIRDANRELLCNQRVYLGPGDQLTLDVPMRLMASPKQLARDVQLAVRELRYLASGDLLGAAEEIVQAGLGGSDGDLGSLSMGEWFPSVGEGSQLQSTPHPVICVGRITRIDSAGRPLPRPLVDWLVLVLNPFRGDGAIDTMGVQSMSAAVSYLLRWDAWAAAARWADIEHDVLDIVDGNAVTPESMSETRKRPPRITEEFRRRAREEPVEKMVARLIPMIGEQDIELLRTRLVLAQSEPPDNKRLFVDSINQMLDHFRLRIQSQGELCRLALNRRSILLAKTSGGTQSFNDPMMTVITVPPRKVGNRFTLPQPT